MKKFNRLKEDLRQWFDPNHPKGGWKRINSKGEAIGPCAREPGEAKPKCMSNEKRAALSKKERASAVRTKRKHDPDAERKGKPINVSNFGKGKLSEDMEQLNEKNVPTSPEKWAQAKSQAKAKFDVYPSAYANGWAAKKYKEMGGGWKSVSEAVKDKYDEGEYDQEGDMAKSDLRSIIANAQKMHDMLDDADNLPEWVQSKITKAEDYISTVANYMAAEMSEETKLQESGGPVLYKKGDDHIEKYGEDSFALYKDGKKAKYYTSLASAKEAMNEEVMQESIKDEPHEIVHKETGKTVSTHKNFRDAYSAYQNLVKASDHAIGHIPKKTNEEVKDLSEAAYVVKHDGVSSDHADADAKKLFVGKTNVNSHMTKYVSSAEKHANMLKSKGFKNVRIQTMNKEEVEQIDEVSPSTLGSYVKRASQDAVTKAMKYGSKRDESGKESETLKKISNRESGIRKATDRLTKEEIEQLEEGRPSQRHPLEGHEYHKKSNAELEYIAKDAHKAAEAMKSHNTTAENKYRDQANDSATVRHFRKTSGSPAWYKKKYGLNEENKPPFEGPYTKVTRTVTDKSGAKHGPMSRVRDIARKAMKKQAEKMKPASVVKESLQESKKADIVKNAMKSAKDKALKAKDKFEADPVLSSEVMKENR